jgi:hypothetical protein
MNNNSFNLYKDIKVGIIGGSLQAFICMPFLTWKFAIQGNIPLPKITDFIKLYRGSIQQISAHTPNTVIQILSNSILLNYLNKKEFSIYEKLGCSSLSGVIGAVIFTPVDNLTIFQQKNKISLLEVFEGKPPPPRNTPKNIPLMEILPRLTPWERIPNYTPIRSSWLKDYMSLGLYRGFNATLIREAIYCSGLLTIGPFFTSNLEKNTIYFNNNHSVANLIGSFSSGLFASIISHPFDTAKTKIQADLNREKYLSIGQTISKIIHKKGPSALFIGIIPRSLQISSAFYIINSVKEYFI